MKFKKLALGLAVVSIVNSSTPGIRVFADELNNTDTQVKSIVKENNKTEDKISNMKKFMIESHKNFEKYKEAFKIPNELIEKVITNGKHSKGGVPENAIDNDIQSFWETGKKNSADFKNDFTVEFKELVEISKITYKIRKSKTGFANKYEIYGSKTSTGDDFELIAKGSGDTTLDTMEINFEEAQVKRIKIVFVQAERDWASIADLGFYKEDKISAEVDSVFEDKLHTTLSPNYNTISKITELEEKIKNHPFEEDLRVVTNLAKSILSGEEVNKSEVIKLSQRGDENAEKLRTKQRYAGSNFDLTGYYAMPGESIEVYVDANKDDILPQIVFAQVGDVDILKPESNAKPNFRIDLKAGRNVIQVPSPELATKPFAIYFSNRAFPNEQEYTPKVRIAGDALKKYPVYIHGKTDVNEYIEQVKNHTGHNMTDVMGDRFLVSTQNTEAKIAYLENNKTPLDLVKEMESMISIYDNISGLDKNDENPLHRPSTGLYHIKLTNGGGSFASNEYVHWSSRGGRNYLKGDIYSWGYLHEFGHQIESNRMRLNEITNNIYSMTTSLIKGAPLDTYVDVQTKMIDKFLVDEKGGFEAGSESTFTYGGKLMVVYQILNYFGVDAYAEASRILREDPDRYANLENITSFILIMSEVTGYDLSPHFEFYNFPVTNETKAFTSKFKKLDKKIEYTLPNANQMISDNVEQFNNETKAIIKDIKTESDGYTLTIGTNDDNKGTAAYEIYRDGKLVGISRGKTYKDIVDSTKTYDYEVVAYDYRVNESIKSEPLNSAIGFKPLFKIEENVQIEINKEFNPKDYVKALTYDGKDISDKMTIDSNVDVSKKGIYTVNCSVKDNGTTVESKFDVEVVSSIDYASDLDWESATSGWSKPAKDKAVGSNNKIKLNISGKVKEFDKGLSAAANSEIVYDIEGKNYDEFIAYAGTDKNYNKSQTSLKFKILADGKEVYSSELMKHNSNAEFIKIPIDGVKELKLIADDNGDGINGDFASWGDARFISRDTNPILEIDNSISTKVGEPIEDIIGNIKATDKEDGDLTSKVKVNAPENIKFNKPGEYKITYTVTDSDNNTITKERTIAIVDMNDEKYLTDYDWKSAVQSYSVTKKDISVSDNKLRLTGEDGKEVVYERGIGSHSKAEIVYDLSDKNYEYFTSFVGIDREQYNSRAAVTFEVYVDGEKRFDSGVMTAKDVQKFIEVDINGAKELKLVVTDGGNGVGQDHATFGDAKLHFVNTERVDLSKLESAIEKANSIEKANYTEETVSKLEEAVNKANEVLELDIITQEQCDKALANIEEAINGLVSIDKEIKIKDEYLEKDIRKELGVTDRALTIRDMYKLTSLTCESYFVRSLEGLEYAKNLETLNIDYNEIADISIVSKLEKLKQFSGKENYRDKSGEIKIENGKYIIEENVVDVNGERLQPKEVILSPNSNPIKLNLEEVLVDNKVVIDASLVGDKNSVDIVYESKTHDYQLYVFSFLDNSSIR